MDIIEIVSRVPTFQGLTESQAEKVAAILRMCCWEEGVDICTEGEKGDKMYILNQGRVEVTRTLTMRVGEHFANRDKALNVLDSADLPVFGDIAIVDNLATRSATVRTLSPCSGFEMTREAFEKLCSEDPDLGMKLLRNIVQSICVMLRKSNNDVLKLTTALSIALSR